MHMPGFDKKTLMMDAGSAFYKSADGFGFVLGAAKTALSPYGKLYEVSEDGGKFSNSVRLEDLPETVEGDDFLLDCSTPWRNCYISCKVEDAGPDPADESLERYVMSLKEGNTNTPLRRGVLGCCAAILLLAGILCGCGFLAGLVCICASALCIWLLISPGTRGQKIVAQIKESLKFP